MHCPVEAAHVLKTFVLDILFVDHLAVMSSSLGVSMRRPFHTVLSHSPFTPSFKTSNHHSTALLLRICADLPVHMLTHAQACAGCIAAKEKPPSEVQRSAPPLSAEPPLRNVQFNTAQMTMHGGFSGRRSSSRVLPGSHRSAVRSLLTSMLQSQTIPEEP
jgi:hypothetical protein